MCICVRNQVITRRLTPTELTRSTFLNMERGFMLSLDDIDAMLRTTPEDFNIQMETQEQDSSRSLGPMFPEETGSSNKLGFYTNLALANVAFLIPGSKININRGKEVKMFDPIEFEVPGIHQVSQTGKQTFRKLKKKTNDMKYFTASMHYLPLKPFETDQEAKDFKKTMLNVNQPDLYFMPQACDHKSYKKTYHVFSENKDYCLAIHGSMFSHERNIIPPLATDETTGGSGTPMLSKIGVNDPEEKRTHFHYCVLYRNENYDKQNPEKNTLENSEWKEMKMTDFVDHVEDLPESVRTALNKFKTLDEKKNYLQMQGSAKLTRWIFQKKVKQVQDCVHSLRMTNILNPVHFSTDVVKSETPEDRSKYNLPELDHDEVNRVVTRKAANEVIRKLKEKGATVTLPYDERPELTKVDKMDWNDLRGCNNIRDEVRRILENATSADLAGLLQEIAAEAKQSNVSTFPNSLLFCGPPGTGKTLCALIMADQAGIPMVNISVSNLINKYVGESERKVKDIFSLMRRLGKIRGREHTGPASILFMDEVDGLVSSKMRSGCVSGVLTTFLEELDGFNGAAEFMFVGCTNVKSMLDPAFLNRMKKVLAFKAFSKEQILDIFRKHAPNLPEKELKVVAYDKRATGLTGRDIVSICEAAVGVRLADLRETKEIAEIEALSNQELAPVLKSYLDSLEQRVQANYADGQDNSRAMAYATSAKPWMD